MGWGGNTLPNSSPLIAFDVSFLVSNRVLQIFFLKFTKFTTMSSSFHSCIRWKISSSAHWWIHRTFQPPTIPRRRPDEYLSKTSVIVRRSVMHNCCKGTPRIFYWGQDLRAEGCERGSWGGSRNPLPTSSGETCVSAVSSPARFRT